jgi:enoyl-CoA hydratase/carnithine racemase
MSDHVLVETSEKLKVLTLNRPEKKNALTHAMYATLAAEVAQAETDPGVHCVLIQANGEMFTAGNDLADFAAISKHAAPVAQDFNPLLPVLARARKPLIAAVNGRAVGIGVTLLLHCDFVLLSEDAQLITPFVNLALVPEAASSLLLPQRIGHARAFEMFVLGEPVLAAKALEWGIANRIVSREALRPAARAAALAIAARAPAAVLATKALMRDEAAILSCMDAEGAQFLAQLKSPEFREAVTAFAEKRAPDFSKFVR